MFFNAVNGASWPVSSVRRIGPAKKTGKTYPAWTQTVDVHWGSDGSHPVEVDRNEVDAFLEVGQHVIPAQPGTFIVLEVGPDDTLETLWKNPVLAWSICQRGYPTPIVMDGRDEDSKYVLMPDGTVHHPFNQMWRTVDDWLAQVTKEAKEEAAADPPATDAASQ